jgi:transposase
MMRPPATITDWLSLDKMFQWVQAAPDELAYKCRMSIWLTHTGKMHAGKVAMILGVSKQAVWLWIRQYNENGPPGLERHGRGGRRWGLLSPQEEQTLLAPLLRRIRAGHTVKAAVVQQMVEEKLHQKVSKSYIYKLLRRHRWSELVEQSLTSMKAKEGSDTFSTLSKPWLRHD